MNEKSHKVANILIRKDRPTEVKYGDLYNWVIWQFPRQMSDGLCGAVHPPLANHTWYPAVIGYQNKKIVIHGHVNQEFSTPNEAADWLQTSIMSGWWTSTTADLKSIGLRYKQRVEHNR